MTKPLSVLRCRWCPAKILRGQRSCNTCKHKKKLANRARYRDRHRDKIRAADRRWLAANKEHRAALVEAWRAKHPKRWLEIRLLAERKYRRKLSNELRELIASLPCLECGEHHGFAQRAAKIRRLLPASVLEIREAHPHLFGIDPRGPGTRTLYRDLEQLGAVRVGGTFYMAAEARAA